MARYRSRMPEGTRNALLVITALIITSTYTTAIQEDKLEDKTIVEMLSMVMFNNDTMLMHDNGTIVTFINGSMVPVSDIDMTEHSIRKIAKTPQFEERKRDVVTGMVVLWGFNTTAYLLSVVWTFILLPAGREYTLWYTAIIATLTVSFGLSTYRKYTVYNFSIDDYDKTFFINIYLIVVVAFLVILFVVYVRYTHARPMKVSEPKTKYISRECKSWCCY